MGANINRSIQPPRKAKTRLVMEYRLFNLLKICLKIFRPIFFLTLKQFKNHCFFIFYTRIGRYFMWPCQIIYI